MTAETISAFFRQYADAFARRDIEALVDLWDFPAVISSSDGNFVISEKDFRKNFQALCSFYERQGMADVAEKVADIQFLDDAVASVVTNYSLLDDHGNSFVNWKHSYVLREKDGDIRAAYAVADLEIKAWAECGTPFGNG